MNSVHGADRTVTEHNVLYFAMELREAKNKRRLKFRDQFSAAAEALKSRARAMVYPEPETHKSGFVGKKLVEEVASALVFDSGTPVVIQHSREGALSQFFSCRLLPYIDGNSTSRIVTISGNEREDCKAVLAQAIQDLAPDVNLHALFHLPFNYWAEFIEKRVSEIGPQRILVIQHFQQFGSAIDRVFFRQILRRLSRLPGFSVAIGQRVNVRTRRSKARAASLWARPGRKPAVVDLGEQIWTAPPRLKTATVLDRLYHNMGPWLDWAWGLQIFKPFLPQEPIHSPAAAPVRAWR